jgi:hypothetical protein
MKGQSWSDQEVLEKSSLSYSRYKRDKVVVEM